MRLLARGVGATALTAVTDVVITALPDDAVVADLGSGGGELLGRIYDRVEAAGVGIDLSAAAAEVAARRYPHLWWVVANADRRLPLLRSSIVRST
jgi:hypothetical protein